MSITIDVNETIAWVEFYAQQYKTSAIKFQSNADNYRNLARQLESRGHHQEANKYQTAANQRQKQADFYSTLAQKRQLQAEALKSSNKDIINYLTDFVNYLNREETALFSCKVIIEYMSDILSFLQEIPPFSEYWNTCITRKKRD